jgi:uncharacterized protein (TIGR00730 family)
MKAICVFCGSSAGSRPEYARAAQSLGKLMAEKGLTIVYGAGNVGLMGVLADSALAAGGKVIGVIPQFLVDKELAHQGLTQLRVVGTMHERKALMAELSDAFIALPGGLGTFEELCEALTWSQLGIHLKPCGALNVLGYFDHLGALLDHAVSEGFVRSEHRALLTTSADPAALLDALAAYQPHYHGKWLGKDAL